MIYELVEMPDGSRAISRVDEDGVVWFIPPDENNSDYQAYLKSLEPEQGEK